MLPQDVVDRNRWATARMARLCPRRAAMGDEQWQK